MSPTAYQPTGRFRILTVLVVFVMTLSVLMWRSVDLHVLQRDHLQREGDARSERVVPIATHRGMLLDRHGEPLAISTPVDSVWVQPQEFIEAQAKWSKLAGLLGMPLKQIRHLVLSRQQREFVYLKRRINPELAQRVMALNLPGLALQREYRRYYPLGEVAAHVVGFTDVDDQGQEGLELAFNDWLQSHPGRKRVMRDRLGHVIKDVELIRAPQPGNDLNLSIDRRLQYLTYRELKRAVKTHRARSGSAVLLDARSGEVLAIVNQPAFNPNNRGQLKGARYRNRAVTDVFEPGSTIKPFTVAAAMEKRLFSVHTMLDTSPGLMRVGTNTIRDIRNYGRIDVATVLKKSSNVGATKIALATPPEAFWKVLSGVGFGTTSGSEFPGEADGRLAHHSRWRTIERATLAFGYGMSVTPLQLAQAYTVLADDGRLKPVTFRRLDEPVTATPVMRPETARRVMHMLEAVVSEEGTASKAAVPGYRVAGKTGTVKKATAGGYTEDSYLSVFVGVAPVSDPRLVMVVSINEPRGEDYYGGEVAAPVFARVMSGALRLLDVPMDDLSNPAVKLALVGGEQ